MAVATIPFIQARNYTRGRSGPIDVLVIHTMEAPEKPDTAENVARWFAGSTAPEASAHYCIDSNSIVQSVKDSDVAWHAPGANHNGLGFEHAGRAAQSAADWSDDYSQRCLKLSAELVARKCREHGIPVVWLRVADLLAGKRGITGHVQVSQAFKRSTHSDPGTSFPVERYLALVRSHLGDEPTHRANAPAVKAHPQTLKHGAKGFQVKRLQRLLKQRGFDPGAIDSEFGPATEKAVRKAQKSFGLEPDGIVGPMTWHALESEDRAA
ncbi:MAG TPA: peptidoglycan-binding domain-containing protein [Gaiellaceae bacterium]|jgi:N-acetyl-anhydromuramyl-L-alanine amidase AmpD|nr:peptidoglycan-binding domain-containing protein [Gaiellaceae bacterium]